MTESITGIDLVKSQILIAAGYKLPEIIQQPVTIRGPCHRVPHQRRESRDVRAIARPHHRAESAGRRRHSRRHRGLHDYVIPPFYDSLVAKLIAYGHDRTEAIARMRRALDMFVVEGIYTTIPLHQRIMQRSGFHRGKLRYVVSYNARREKALSSRALFRRPRSPCAAAPRRAFCPAHRSAKTTFRRRPAPRAAEN